MRHYGKEAKFFVKIVCQRVVTILLYLRDSCFWS